jgi:hypothetical protein
MAHSCRLKMDMNHNNKAILVVNTVLHYKCRTEQKNCTALKMLMLPPPKRSEIKDGTKTWVV